MESNYLYSTGITLILGIKLVIMLGLAGFAIGVLIIYATLEGLKRRPVSESRLVRAGLITLAVAAVVRVAIIVAAGSDWLYGTDPYVQLAERLASGEGYVTAAGDPTSYLPPGWPFLLGSIFWLFGTADWVIMATTTLLGFIFILSIYLIVSSISNRSVAVIAANLAAWYPAGILYSFSIGSDLPFAVFAAITILGFIKLNRGLANRAEFSSIPWAVTFGIASAMLAWVRAYGIVVSVVLVIILLVRLSPRWRTATVLLVIATLPMVLLHSGWVARNVEADLGPVFVSSNGGVNLWIGNHPGATGQYQSSSTFDPPAGYSRDQLGDMSEPDRDRIFRRAGLSYVLDNPVTFVRTGVKKLFIVFASDLSSLSGVNGGVLYSSDSQDQINFSKPILMILTTIINGYYWGIMLLAAIGFVGLWKRNHWEWIVLLGGIPALVGIVGVVFFAIGRLHLAAMPFVIVLATIGIGYLTTQEFVKSQLSGLHVNRCVRNRYRVS